MALLRHGTICAILLLMSRIATSQNETDPCPMGACQKEFHHFWSYAAGVSCSNASCTGVPLDDIEYLGVTDTMDLLDLSHNKITHVPMLGHYEKLQYLDLSWNSIETVDEKAFWYCTELVTLNISHNSINAFHARTFLYNNKLVYLQLSHNTLMEVPPSFFSHSFDLAFLDLSFNQLPNITHFGLIDLTSLKVLRLDNNWLQMIDKRDLDGTHQLEELHLENNLIHSIHEEAFADSSKMTMVNLTDNQLTNLTRDTFRGLDNLHVLDLSDNTKLANMDKKIFHDSIHLEGVYLNRTGFVVISRHWLPESVKSFSIKECSDLKEIQNDTFSRLPNLATIIIRGNPKLSFIAPGAFDKDDTMATEVDLSNNALTTLDQHLLHWADVTSLDLRGNPWDCDCHLDWMATTQFREEVKKNGPIATCGTPYRLKGQDVTTVNYTEFRCDFVSRYGHRLGIALVVMTTFVFLLTIVGLAYRYRARVFPCWLQSGVNYKSLYSRDMDNEDPAVTVQWDGGSDDEKTALKKAKAPTPV